ncbi:Retrovirus-related Pol polyprotein from transposon TNT 1-94 [Senna tora]|uniref:Retrovirus-related Pol polyprotein from transposon TNT 1-94 n=1 Tax=Senna tora TaxID=362788 RepID=A0A835CB16_9FABA|nr:Retrovirus-related Pol polyprotein from transposon TNT 1-94 [Senna tora]
MLALIHRSSLVFLLPWLVLPVAILLLNRHTSRNASSFPSVSISPYIRVHAADSHMAVDRDPINEESLRASVESRPLITCLAEVPYSFVIYCLEQENIFSTSGEQGPLPISLGEGIELVSLSTRVRLAEYYYPSPKSFSQESQVFLKTAIKFNFCVANHPFPMPLLGHDGTGLLFFVFVAEVIGVIPPFSYFVLSFLNCTNVCPALLVPNIWVFLWGFEEIYESIGVEPSLRFFFHLFQVQRRFAQDFVSSGRLWLLRFLFFLRYPAMYVVGVVGLSKAERVAVAVLTTRRAQNMATRTYEQWQSDQGQAVDVSSSPDSSDGAVGMCLPSLFLLNQRRVLERGVIEEITRYYKKEAVIESSRHWGKEPLRGDKEEGPRVRQGVLSSTSVRLDDLPFPQLAIFSAGAASRSGLFLLSEYPFIDVSCLEVECLFVRALGARQPYSLGLLVPLCEGFWFLSATSLNSTPKLSYTLLVPLSHILSGLVLLVYVFALAIWIVTSGYKTPKEQQTYTGQDTVHTANGNATCLAICTVGNSEVHTHNHKPFLLKDSYHVPSTSKNVISVSRFSKDNKVYFQFFFDHFLVKSQESHELLLKGRMTKGLYVFDSLPLKHKTHSNKAAPSANMATIDQSSSSSLNLWHYKLHASSPTSLHHCSHNDTSSQLPTLSRDTTSNNSTSLPVIPTLPMSRVLPTTCTTNPSHGTSPSAACFPASSHAKSSTNESDTSSPCLPTRDPPLPSHHLHQVYVDDVIITGNSSTEIQQLMCNLHSQFSLKSLGSLHYFLDIEAISTQDGFLLLSQSKYENDLLVRAGLENSTPQKTPMVAGLKLSSHGSEPCSNPSLYRSIVGALYYVTLTRPEISFCVNKLFQFIHNPQLTHWQAAKRVLRYLKDTFGHGLLFQKTLWLVMAGSETPKNVPDDVVKDIIIYGMDACGSTPLRCTGRGRLSSSKKKQSRKKRTDGLRRRVSSQISKGSLDKKSIMTGVPDCSSIANLAIHGGVPDCNPFPNPAFHGSIEEAWLDSVAVFDCECDDDYQRVADVVVSLNGSEGGLIPNFPIKDANHETSFLLSRNILNKCLSQMNFSKPDKSFISSCSQILTTSLEKS